MSELFTFEPSEFQIIEDSIEFDETNWNIPQIVTVVTTDDNIVQGNTTEIIRHTVRSSDRNFDGLEVANVNVNLSDNDVAEVLITQTSNRTEVSEDGLTDTYRVVLNSQPTADVTVTITPDSQVNLGRGAETEINLIFTPQNWNEPQTVSVAAIDDDDVEVEVGAGNKRNRSRNATAASCDQKLLSIVTHLGTPANNAPGFKALHGTLSSFIKHTMTVEAVHEAVKVSLGPVSRNATGWNAARKACLVILGSVQV
jgi:hypothetical protein